MKLRPFALFFTTCLTFWLPVIASDQEEEDCCEEICEVCCPEGGPVNIDPCYSIDMLDRLSGRPWKQLILLDRWCAEPNACGVVLSAQLRASLFYAHATVRDKFAYLGRFPGNFRGDDASVADINDFTFALTYSPICWVHAYWEFLHSDQITFSADARQGTNHTQKVYVIIGDLDHFPVYITVGKRDVGFGAMYTVNPFSPSITWHYFGALHDGISIGYDDNGWSFEFTALNGGRGIRVADTNEKGKIDNWALNGRYHHCGGHWSATIGAGYLHSTIYDGNPPEHVGPPVVGPRNGAWNVNLHACYKQFKGYIEFTSTERDWESTVQLVQTISGGLQYECRDPWLERRVRISIEHGEGLQGPRGSQFRKNAQSVLGLEYRYCDNARFCFEYVQTNGFAPLINIANPGVSSRSAQSHVFQFGVTGNI